MTCSRHAWLEEFMGGYNTLDTAMKHSRRK